MKVSLRLLVLFLTVTAIHGQELNVFNLDPSEYPLIKAKMYLFDSEGKLDNNLDKNDFQILEDSSNCEITLLTCPPFKPPEALSTVLVIDNSSSMRDYRLSLARIAARSWVDALPDGKSECAIANFNDDNNLLTDFTSDKNKLRNAINNIFPVGGTNYDAALLDNPAGGVEIAKNGKYKRILVFLTDGQPNFAPKEQEIIDLANQNNIVIYCVTLFMPAPDCIKHFSEQTGGEWFENVTNINDAQEIYRKILQKELLNEPCEIQWLSKPGCNITVKESDITALKYNASTKKKYIIPTTKRSYLKIHPASVKFKDYQLGYSYSSTITLTAVNADYNLTEVKGANPYFDIEPKTISLSDGESQILVVTYLASDTNYQFDEVKFISGDCIANLYISAGNEFDLNVDNTLKLTHPNGNEIFLVGSDSVITWKGITPDDTVKLEYSFDNGANWNLVTDKGFGLKHIWSPIPNTVSNRCVMRVRKISGDSYYSVMGYGYINDIEFSPGGEYIALASSQGYIFMIDPESGNIIRSFQVHQVLGNALQSGVSSISFSPDGSKIASAGFDGKIKLLNLTTGINELEIKQAFPVFSISFNNDASVLASSGANKLIYLWNPATGDTISTLSGHKNNINIVKFSKSGALLASGSDDKDVRIWDLNNQANNKIFSGHAGAIYTVEFDSSETQIASASADKTIKLWNLATNKIFKTLYNYCFVYSMKYSHDSQKLYVAGSDYTIKIWDTKNGTEIKSTPEENVRIMDINPLTDTLAFAGQNSFTLRIADVIDSLDIINRFRKGHKGSISKVQVSANGKFASTLGSDTSIIVWDLNNKNVIFTFKPDLLIKDFSMDKAGNYLACLLRINADTNELRILKVSDGTIVCAKTDTNYTGSLLNIITLNPDGSQLACSYKNSSLIDLLNTKTLLPAKTFDSQYKDIKSLSYSVDGRTLLVTTTNIIYKLDVYGGPFGGFLSANSNYSEFSPDGDIFATLVNNVQFRNSVSGELVNSILNNDIINSFSFTLDGKWLTTASSGIQYGKTTNVKLWEVSSGYMLESLKDYLGNVYSAQFMSDGNRVLYGTDDGSLMLWHINSLTKLTDNSDTLWSIVKPLPESRDVNMGNEILGESRDSLVNTFIVNKGTYPFTVDSIFITGNDSTEFSLVSGFPPFLLKPGDSSAVEFRFSPSANGYRNSFINIITQAGLLRQRIYGYGISRGLRLNKKIIDFGKVMVGDFKDSVVENIIENIGGLPVNFTNSYHYFPNDSDFTTLDGNAPFILDIMDSVTMTLQFKPVGRGKTSGNLVFDFEGPDSPIYVQLLGEGYQLIPQIQTSKPQEFNLICDNYMIDTLVVSNTGAAPLLLKNIKITNNKFTIYPGFSQMNIMPGLSSKLIIKYSSDIIASDTAFMTLISNAEPDSLLEIKLVGKKDSIGLSLSYYTIDLGYLCSNEQKDTNFTISNTGSLSAGALISAPSDFTIDVIKPVIDISGSKNISINYNGSPIEKIINEQIIIKDTICGFEDILKITGIVRQPEIFTQDLILYGMVGFYVDGELSLQNNTNYDIIITNPPVLNDNRFSYVNAGFPVTIKANTNEKITLRYTPSDTSEVILPVSIYTEPCNLQNDVNLIGRSVAAYAHLKAANAEGKAGDIVNIPIHLINPVNLELSKASGFKCTVSFNATLLEPLDYPQSQIIDGVRKISLDLPLFPLSGNILTSIKCFVGLGNAEKSVISISDFTAIDGAVSITKEDGTFTLLDICREGGDRLINPNNAAGIISLTPNPVGDFAELEYSLSESGYTKIYLSDLLSNHLVNIYENINSVYGKNKVIIDLTELSSGFYILVLETPTVHKVKELIISK